MIVESQAPNYFPTRIEADTVGEFIDRCYQEWAFYWGTDIPTSDIESAWNDLVFYGEAKCNNVRFKILY